MGGQPGKPKPPGNPPMRPEPQEPKPIEEPPTTFPFRRAGSMPAVISLDPITAINARAPADVLRALAEMPIAGSHLACPHIPIASGQRCTHHQRRR